MLPDEAGTGQVPASEANAASERTRPACDHAIRTVAATTAPTPTAAVSSGALVLTNASRDFRLLISSESSARILLASRTASARHVAVVASSDRDRQVSIALI